MSIAPWHELTPGAQAALLAELDQHLASAPAQHNVPAVREAVAENPAVIPLMIERLREPRGATDRVADRP